MKSSAESTYSLRSIEKMLGLGRSVITSIIGAGFVSPSRGSRNEYRFSFQDVVLLRTAHHLIEAKIPSRRMLRSLKQLRSKLPIALPMSGLRITAIGNDVVVRDGDAYWEAGTGQLMMDFEVAGKEGEVTFLIRGPNPDDGGAESAVQWFERGDQLEREDTSAAEKAYRQAIAIDPGHADSNVNLGALLCESGRFAEAVALFDEAIKHCPEEPLLHFNRAIALEDQSRIEDALVSYDHCLALDPEFADAHYNAARLHEQAGHTQRAVRHYSAYRRLQQ